ncbi:reverse transcriptase [Purpureocillium lavendulum]|uniref:Reverse transcriptase n=1 Tax=Purpureocillium lavendulum TaxID=1247861 RepID=A0AB34FJC4_9HYPO|nr:reverse transcriptase [Purpureocillium lavendulum]
MATPWPEDQTWPTEYREHAAKLSTYLQKAMSSTESPTGPPIEPQKVKHAFFGALTLIIKVQALPNLAYIHEAVRNAQHETKTAAQNTSKAISDIRDELKNANKISQQTITTIQDNANVALATGATAKEAVEIGKATYKMVKDMKPGATPSQSNMAQTYANRAIEQSNNQYINKIKTVNSAETEALRQFAEDWEHRIGNGATVRILTYGVLAHCIRTSSMDMDHFDEVKDGILQDNKPFIPNAEIKYIGWLTRSSPSKSASSVIVEFARAEDKIRPDRLHWWSRWFLVATGFEVSARLNGGLKSGPNISYLFSSWLPLIFYAAVSFVGILDADTLRDYGWLFKGPSLDEPWWTFYTMFQFKLVRWDAIAEVVPTMLALTLFSILHVPINVPALALKCGEVDVDLNKEFKLHGYSNFLWSCFGSIQNYLVYANTVLFIQSGGDRRLAGYILAVLTFGVMLTGPSVVAFIPVMMVGTLIFDLGFELLLEAVWLPRKELTLVEYLTVIVIMAVMGTTLLLALAWAFYWGPYHSSFTLQVYAIDATNGGGSVISPVRRNPLQHCCLRQAAQQITEKGRLPTIIPLWTFINRATVRNDGDNLDRDEWI